MTTRETTALLPLNDIDLDLSLGDRAMVLGYGAVQWPWLLRSLHGGRKADKAALLAYLDLPQDALPNLGSWKADTNFLWHIVRAIEEMRPAQVVELGCGASSFVIARALQKFGGGNLVSYDQHREFASITQEWVRENGMTVDIRHAPLGPSPVGWAGHWYQLVDVPTEIDLLVVDGPPWAIHPHVRGAAASLFPRLKSGGRVLLDDAARPGERVVARRWRNEHRNMRFILDSTGAKGTLIGFKLPG
ncbi:MAG: class I SAM-dependent methyltransferase [Sphingomonadaceae bacterium]|nr:class I SAM-dependent methyltransferase [Sphingomonadaceae bacterium]